jgi:hypothetical protein
MHIYTKFYILLYIKDGTNIYIALSLNKGKLKKFFQSGSNPGKDKILRKGPYVGLRVEL